MIRAWLGQWGIAVKIFEQVSAALATLALGLGLAAAAPSVSNATVVYDFSGQCGFGCSGVATGVLTLTSPFVAGDSITDADFVSFTYKSSDLSLDILNGATVSGGLTSSGSILSTGSTPGELSFQGIGESFSASSGVSGESAVAFSGGSPNLLTDAKFTSAAPEPATWAMMLIGLGMVGFVLQSKKSAVRSIAA